MIQQLRAEQLDAPEPQPLSTRAAGAAKKAVGVVARLFGLLLVLATAVALGIACVLVLSVLQPTIPEGARVAFGASAILLVLKQLFETAPDAWAFVASRRTDALTKFASQVAVAAMGIGTAAFFEGPAPAVAQAAPPPPAPDVTVKLANMPLPLIAVDDRNLLVVPILFGEREDELATNDSQRLLIDDLTKTLAACIQGPGDLVQVDVRAFASTSGSDTQNRSLANRRARSVMELMTAAIPSEIATGFEVTLSPWSTAAAMKRKRRFNDATESGRYSAAAGKLNRRAEIWIRSAGSCYPE